MITKFEKYNESIKSLLVGPTKEEVLLDLKNKYSKGNIDFITFYKKCKNNEIDCGLTEKEIRNKLGYKEIFHSSEEFFSSLVKNLKDKETKSSNIKVKNGKYLFEHTKKFNHLYVNYNEVWFILKYFFNMDRNEVKSFLNKMVKKYFGWISFEISNIHEMYN